MTERTIAGKNVLITGANRGLGLALVEEALSRGARTVYAGMRTPVAHADLRVTPVRLDITDTAQIDTAAEQITALDILINNAGISVPDELADRRAMDDHLAVNLFGTYAVSTAFRPHLVRSRGSIVNVLSLASLAPVPVTPAYAISKAAAASLTQSQRAALLGAGVSVHGVYAGPIDTEMVKALDLPKTPPSQVATAILDGVEAGSEDIFPDPLAAGAGSGWDEGIVKNLERANLAMFAEPSPPQGFTTTLITSKTTQEVYDAVQNPNGWWHSVITGATSPIGATFRFDILELHRCALEVKDAVPGERVAWHVVENEFGFIQDKTEWIGTDLEFDIAAIDGGTKLVFTHVGLVPDYECYTVCENAWTNYIQQSLRKFIETGVGEPGTY